ncbi:MAG: hypothetical protein AAF388_20980, partial [Bacteroidota bacterium]
MNEKDLKGGSLSLISQEEKMHVKLSSRNHITFFILASFEEKKHTDFVILLKYFAIMMVRIVIFTYL